MKSNYWNMKSMMIKCKMRRTMQFRRRFSIIQNNPKKSTLANFKKYLILNHHTKFYTLIVFKKSCKRLSLKSMIRKRKIRCNYKVSRSRPGSSNTFDFWDSNSLATNRWNHCSSVATIIASMFPNPCANFLATVSPT